MKQVVFRADSSLEIGIGHVMRCLTLADEFRRRGAHCIFIMRDQAGSLSANVRDRGNEVIALPKVPSNQEGTCDASPPHANWLQGNWYDDAAETIAVIGSRHVDWVVVDHYGIDAKWEDQVKPYCDRMMAIDDLADRSHSVDLLLDQNLGRENGDYGDFTRANCRILTGVEYALLRPEFAELRAASLSRRENAALRHILISLGGVDAQNMTGRILEFLERSPLPRDCLLSVVMGPHAPWLNAVRNQADGLPWRIEILHNHNDMAGLMAAADLAIGAAGATSWERCCLGLPTLLVSLAANQQENCVRLTAAGAAIYLDEPTLATQDVAKWFHDHRVLDRAWLLAMSRRASELVDGSGVRVVTDIMMEMST